MILRPTTPLDLDLECTGKDDHNPAPCELCARIRGRVWLIVQHQVALERQRIVDLIARKIAGVDAP